VAATVRAWPPKVPEIGVVAGGGVKKGVCVGDGRQDWPGFERVDCVWRDQVEARDVSGRIVTG